MKKILLVEDDETKCKDIEAFVLEKGHSVTIRKALNSAMKELGKSAYDLILLDMSLPRFETIEAGNYCPFGGIEFLNEMRRKKIEVPVIVVTQYSLFGEGRSTRSFDSIKEECLASNQYFVEMIKYRKNEEEWRINLSKHL